MAKQNFDLKTTILGLATGVCTYLYFNNGSDITADKPNSPNITNRIAEPAKKQTLQDKYQNFRFPNELETIAFHANRIGVELPLLLAIREAENGREGLQFGIIPNSKYNNDSGFMYNGQLHQYEKDNGLSKQASWAAHTIRRNHERFNLLQENERAKYLDFIDYLGDKYAPLKANNDPKNLNSNWKRNVRAGYNSHKHRY